MSKIITQLNRLSTFASRRNAPRSSFLPLYTIGVTLGKLSTFRPLTFRLLLTFHFSLLIFNCGLDVEDPTPPSPPVWVEKSLPEEWPERGIDAHESGGIFLEWEPAPEGEDIIAYHIYRALYFELQDSLGDFEQLISLDVLGRPSYSYVDRSVAMNVRHEYTLKSEDNAGNCSAFSDTCGYTLMSPVQALNMQPNGLSVGLGTERELSWIYDYAIAMEDYCLTLQSTNNQFMLRHILNPGNYVGIRERWQIPDSVLLIPGNSYQWRVDMQAGYTGGRESAGSESAWAWFLYPGP